MTVFTTEAQQFSVGTSTGQVQASTSDVQFVVSASGTNVNTTRGAFTVRVSTGANPIFGAAATGVGLFIPTVTSATSTDAGFGAYISVTDGAGNSYVIPVRSGTF